MDEAGRVRVALAAGNHPQLSEAFRALSKIDTGGLVDDPSGAGPGLYLYDAVGKIRASLALSSNRAVLNKSSDSAIDLAETQLILYPVREGDGKIGLYWNHHTAWFQMFGKDMSSRFYAEVDAKGGSYVEVGRERKGVRVNTEQLRVVDGLPKIELGFYEDARTGLVVRDRVFMPRAIIGSAALKDQSGRQSVFPESSVLLFDGEGDLIASMPK